jgi:hypothetical protein
MFSEDEKSLTELIKAFRAALQTPPSDCPTFVFRESVYFKKDLLEGCCDKNSAPMGMGEQERQTDKRRIHFRGNLSRCPRFK